MLLDSVRMKYDYRIEICPVRNEGHHVPTLATHGDITE